MDSRPSGLKEEWKPIGTAPKDGTAILVRSTGTGTWPAVASWCGTYWGFHKFTGNLGNIQEWAPLSSSERK